MTKDELCIRAAKYAIGKMTLSGSFGFVTITKANEGLQQISWAEVVEWLDNVIDRQALIDAINTYDTYGFVEPNCFVRNPKGNVVAYLHYDDVIKCIKCQKGSDKI